MIYLNHKLSPAESKLSLPEKVSFAYRNYLSKHDPKPESLVCFVHPSSECDLQDQLETPEGIIIKAWNYILPNNFYFVSQK